MSDMSVRELALKLIDEIENDSRWPKIDNLRLGKAMREMIGAPLDRSKPRSTVTNGNRA